jgi:hypothetical protein
LSVERLPLSSLARRSLLSRHSFAEEDGVGGWSANGRIHLSEPEAWRTSALCIGAYDVLKFCDHAARSHF